MAYKRSTFKLSGKIKDYNPTYFSKFSEAELRKEYSRLRSIAKKRMSRIEKSDWNWTNTYQSYKKDFPELSQIKRRSDLEDLLSRLGHYVYNMQSSIKGLEEIRDKSIATLEKHEFDFVTKENWREWVEFIKSYKKIFSGKSPTPEELKAFEMREELMEDPDDARFRFETYLRSKGLIELIKEKK